MDIYTVQQNEFFLLENSVRKSRNILDTYLAEDFLEFWASWKIYSKQDILSILPNSPETLYSPFNPEVKQIWENIIQIYYQLSEIAKETWEVRKTLRNSLWRKENGDWKMFFHQWTITDLDF